ncbi:putative phospholipase A2 [Paramyrothecium foliicola]|nr:putative phospholipase A2 [Paramyrothecium foliicola]
MNHHNQPPDYGFPYDDDDGDDYHNNHDAVLELSSLDPDAPLAMAPSSPTSTSTSSPPPDAQMPMPRPKWLNPGRSGRRTATTIADRLARWASAASAWLLAALRPRPTWRYLLCAAVSLYALACVVRGVPLLASPLPGYTGEHRVGAVDVEVPLAAPRRVSDVTFKRGGDGAGPAFEVETVLFTVYYPVAHAARSPRPRHYWIPKPVAVTAEGYAKLAGINNFILRPVLTFALWAIGGGITIPAEVDVPLLGSEGDSSSSVQKFPVMVFSHGMASSRTDYTHYLGELASRGHVVAAIEHRDGSSPGSLVQNTKTGKDRKVISFQYKDLQTSADDPAMDIVRMHTDQLAFRDVEIRETVDVLRRINDGHGADVRAANARGEGTHFADWAGRLDFDHLTIGGHSYGATGALQALKGAPSADNPAIGGVILDPGKSSGPLNHDVAVPVLVVHSTSWSSAVSAFYGRPHFDTVRDLTRSVLRRTRERASWFLTSLGTSHPSVTDAPLLEPLLLSWTTGASANVKEALKEYVRVTSDFFNFLEKGKATGVLDEEVTHDTYNHWVSDERAATYPAELAKFWEVHISPRGPNGEDSEKDETQ